MNIAEPIIRIEKRLVSLADDLKELKELKEGLIKVNQSLDNLKTAINKHEEKSNTTEHKRRTDHSHLTSLQTHSQSENQLFLEENNQNVCMNTMFYLLGVVF